MHVLLLRFALLLDIKMVWFLRSRCGGVSCMSGGDLAALGTKTVSCHEGHEIAVTE